MKARFRSFQDIQANVNVIKVTRPAENEFGEYAIKS
jgi:hypothetical protein